jgi:hypothetical protein
VGNFAANHLSLAMLQIGSGSFLQIAQAADRNTFDLPF